MIEALIGLSGVIVGSMITISKDVWISRLERRQSGSFAAMQIVCVLDQFVETCVDIVSDDGTIYGQYAGRTDQGEEYLEAQVSCPDELTLPDGVDWKSIAPDIMYRVLALPNALKQANRHIRASSEHSFPPHYEEVFDARQESYADLGLEALEIIRVLREDFSIPEKYRSGWNTDWDPKAIFKEQKARIEENAKLVGNTVLKEFEVSENE